MTTVKYNLGGYHPKACYVDASLQEGGWTDTANLPPALEETKTNFILIPHACIPSEGNILDHDIALLQNAHHVDPFSVLGPHHFQANGRSCVVVRCWVKDADRIDIRMCDMSEVKIGDFGEVVTMADHTKIGDYSTASLKPDVSDGWVTMEPRCEWLFQKSFEWKRAHLVIGPVIAEGKIENMLELVGGPLLYEIRVSYRGSESASYFILRDAYSFPCLVSDKDLSLFQSGSCWHVDNLMGSHMINFQGADGVRFAVWAPNAEYVSVVGDFNQWDGRAHPMRKRHSFGIWELFIPTIVFPGQKYGYKIHTAAGKDVVKIDPYAQEFENPPAYASIISSCDDAYKAAGNRYQWGDQEWVEKRVAERDNIRRKPMSIYEVHLPSWMRGDNDRYLSYRELAHRLVDHLTKLNFTHVEFLPLAHHPFEGSWGYQVSGLYAPYSRLGSPDDFKFLIDKLHLNGFGVFVDFVPGHFVKDSWGLIQYDGQPCFEYSDPREGEHRSWGTMVFNFRRNEVRSFLLGAAYHWLRRYHLDGLRIDAVSSMLYKNYCRDDGDWIPNEYGGDANLEAINMLQELNWVVHKEFPGVFTMAEEATSWKGVTNSEDGLGFDAKWDLGWMNDTLAYLCTPTPLRPMKHQKLTFRGLYMGHERWVLPLSHDEVVSGKGSLLDKCGFAGSSFDERIQTMKALLAYQVGLGGRPLIFMGSEFAQGREWSESRSVDWHEADEPARAKFMIWVADLLGVYKAEPALHAGDDDPWTFKWTECDNAESCIVAWLRNWSVWLNDILIICNFGGRTHNRFPIGVPHGGKWKVLLNSDDWKYGGGMRGVGNSCKVRTTQGGRLGWPYCLWLDLPPFCALVLKAPQPKFEEVNCTLETLDISIPVRNENPTIKRIEPFTTTDLIHTLELNDQPESDWQTKN